MALTAQEAARLATLRAQRDALAGGTAVSEIEYAGQRTAFAKANPDFLLQQIEELEAKERSPRRRTRGAVTFRI
jgi:hypothetical protein